MNRTTKALLGLALLAVPALAATAVHHHPVLARAEDRQNDLQSVVTARAEDRQNDLQSITTARVEDRQNDLQSVG